MFCLPVDLRGRALADETARPTVYPAAVIQRHTHSSFKKEDIPMHHIRRIGLASSWILPCLVVTVFVFGPANNNVSAQTKKGASLKPEQTEAGFHEYKGVTLGMTTDDARKKLGTPTEKDNEQDFFVFSDTESAQVYYDKSHTVIALSVNYVGETANTPKSTEVLGKEVEAKPDGSKHELIRFLKAGYWVSYSRTAGDSPLVTITIQKLN